MKAAQQAAREPEHRFPVRIRIGIPAEGLGNQLDQIVAWLDANCGAEHGRSRPRASSLARLRVAQAPVALSTMLFPRRDDRERLRGPLVCDP